MLPNWVEHQFRKHFSSKCHFNIHHCILYIYLWRIFCLQSPCPLFILLPTFSLLHHSTYLGRVSLSILHKPPSNSYLSLVCYYDLLILCSNKIPLLHCLLLMEFEWGGQCGFLVSPSPPSPQLWLLGPDLSLRGNREADVAHGEQSGH